MLYRLIPLGLLVALAGIAHAEVLPPSPQNPTSLQIAQSEADRAGQVDPNKPIRIEIANAGGVDIMFSLTQPVSATRRLPAGGEIAFGTTHTSFLPPPVYLIAYAEMTEVAINFYVLSTDNNVVEVVVGGQYSDVPAGRTLTIEPNGDVYVF